MTRLPAVPIMVHDPYFSVWMPDDRLTNVNTAHWCKSELPVFILLDVDGFMYRLLGTGEAPALEFSQMEVTPLSTHFEFETAAIRLKLSFTSPLLLDDLDRASTPISLIRAEACSLDGKAHEVSLTLEASDRFCWRGDEKPEIGMYPMPYPELSMMRPAFPEDTLSFRRQRHHRLGLSVPGRARR